MRRVLTLALLCSIPAMPATAQLAAPADGLYEDFPSIFMQASGPLASAPTLLVRWVDVRTRAGVTTVTFEPDARVTWRITWGPHGPREKVTLVDGREWTRSRFVYDAAGHLSGKHVTGHGAEGGLTYAYETDAVTGELRARTATLHLQRGDVVERVELARGATDVTVTVLRDGLATRRDRFDAQRRLLETRFFDAHGHEAARLRYVRNADGSLRTVRRRLGPHRGAADPMHRDLTLTSSDVQSLVASPIEHHEALLLLGSPGVSSDEGRGPARRISTDFADDACWMNQTSGIDFDPTGLIAGRSVGCICGYCVAASLPRDDQDTASALGVQEHWTRGPWIRIDGAIDVTADHELVTPEGPRAAGVLRVGDVVTASDGSPHEIRSLELLPEDTLRLGVNVMTERGTFAAGGLLFVSETARLCAPE